MSFDPPSYALGKSVGGGGSTGGVMKITLTWNDDTQSYSMDKTAGQILTALQSGVLAFVVDDEFVEADKSGSIGVAFINNFEFVDDVYKIDDSTSTAYYAATLDDYPTDQQPGG